MDAFEKLAELNRKKFWETLAKSPDLIVSMNKYLYIRAIPFVLWDDFKNETFVRCAARFGDFDSSKSAFNTWVIFWLKAVVRNYFRHNRGSPGEDRRAVKEADLRRGENEMELDDFPQPGSPVKPEVSMAIREVLASYSRTVKNYPNHSIVFNELLNNGFDIPDARIADHIGISRTMVGILRKQILAELGTMLIRLGVDKND